MPNELIATPKNSVLTNGMPPGALALAGNCPLPSLIIAAGPQATKRHFEFFTVTIRNDHTRSSYFRACRVFFE
jgi:hypothetical protein